MAVTFVVDYALYPFDVLVSTGNTAEILRHFKKLGCGLSPAEIELIELEHTGRGRCVILESGGTILRLKYSPNTPERIGTLSHEVFHAITFLFERIDIKLTRESDEAFAYAIEYLTRQILEGFKMHKKSVKGTKKPPIKKGTKTPAVKSK